MAIQSAASLLEQMRWRYAVKKFDPTRKIPESTWQALAETLVLTPSSYGLQPWKFIVVTDQALKQALRAHSWNQSQVEDCSHYVIIATKKTMGEADIDRHLNRIVEVRNVAPDSLAGFRKGMVGDIVTGYRSTWVREWAARQAYIALGNLMTAAASMGVDACPMEGLEPAKYDELLGLTDYGVVVACATGYRHPEDRFATLAKVRFPLTDIVEYR